MTCPSCGADNPAGKRFCGDCGASLVAACPGCGAENPPGKRFCGDCGTPLPVTGSAAARAVAPASGGPAGRRPTGSPRTATGPVTERRLVTVLFADLVGFTPFAEERDAEAVRETLSRYFELASEVIGRYGGTVERFIGDAVMAVWGAPTAHEDDAERGVRAALDLVDAVRALDPGFAARAAVLTGEAAVAVGATDQGLVAGDLVNTASRVQSVAPPGTVLVGEATMRAASAAILFEPLGGLDLKGKASPVPAWRALRVVAQRRGQGRTELPEPPFVGREEELRLLKDLVATTGRHRRARLVLVGGPAGIGKSRLAWELEKYIDGITETVYWHRGRSPAYGEGITFWALGEMVRRRAGLAEDDDASISRARLASMIREYVPGEEDSRWVEPALLALLGLEPAPAGGRDVLFAAWRILFERIAEQGTTVLLFEDLQWADSGLLDFIEHLVEWSRRAPILVVALARPELFERRPDWGARIRNLTRLTLEPLTDAQMRALVDGFVPGLPGAVVEAIVDRADGVPLYAVETVRALLTEGRLERSDEGYRPVGSLERISVPETLRSLIASRLDALDPLDRGVVADAAVLGQTFSLAALSAVSGAAPPELEARLQALAHRELFDVEADPRSPERGQYRFVQSLIREVAYGTLGRRERRSRHLAAARFFESLGDEELAGALAAHYLAAHGASEPGPERDAVAVQARLALTAAAQRSAALGAHEQAISQLVSALAVTTDDRDRVELLTRAARSADAAADSDAGVGYAREAAALASKAGDRVAAGRALSALGALLINAGQVREAVTVLEEARDALPSSEAGEGRAEILTTLARAYFRHDMPRDALAAADAALEVAERLEDARLISEALNNRGAALLYLGRRREPIALMRGAVEIAHEGGHVDAELRALANLASVLSAEDAAAAHDATLASLVQARRAGHRHMASWALAFHAWWTFREGRGWDEVVAELEAELDQGPAPAAEARLLGVLALFREARGEPVEPLRVRHTELIRGTTDPSLAAQQGWLEADRAFYDGDSVRASDGYLACAAPGLAVTLGLAARAALWAGDAARLRTAVTRLDSDPEVPTDARSYRIAAHAALDALEGRSAEARAGFREVLRRERDAGSDFELACFGVDMLIALGSDDPEAAAAAGVSRTIFERVLARPWITWLDAALARGIGSVAAARSAEPRSGAGALADAERA